VAGDLPQDGQYATWPYVGRMKRAEGPAAASAE